MVTLQIPYPTPLDENHPFPPGAELREGTMLNRLYHVAKVEGYMTGLRHALQVYDSALRVFEHTGDPHTLDTTTTLRRLADAVAAQEWVPNEITVFTRMDTAA